MFHRIEFSEADLDRLASLKELRTLIFASSALTDDVLARLKGLTKLDALGLEGSSITDAGLTSLLGMTELTYLDLDSTAITDAGLKEIAKLKSLNDLSLVSEGERSGRIQRTHPSLRLGQTRTTVNGIDELQRAFPTASFSHRTCPIFRRPLPRRAARIVIGPNGCSRRIRAPGSTSSPTLIRRLPLVPSRNCLPSISTSCRSTST